MPKFSLSIADIIGFIIIYQSLFFSVNLYLQDSKPKAFNRVLSAFTGLFALNFLNIFLINQGILSQDQNFGLVYGLLYGPIFYFYALFLMEKERSFRRKELLHFLPAIFAFLLILMLGNLLESEQKLAFISFLVLVHVFFYLGKSYLSILAFQKVLKDNFSEIESRKLSWLRSLIISTAFILLFASLEAFVPLSYAKFYGDIYFVLICLFVLMMINFMFYKGLKYPEILKNELLPPAQKGKYQGSNLDQERASSILQKLDNYMSVEKPYLNEELTIRELAHLLDVSSKHLSQVINEKKGMNFFDFINQFRIEEACTLLAQRSSSELRINEIMYQVGFRSKSTFNQVFKDKMGMTPKAYKSSQKNKR